MAEQSIEAILGLLPPDGTEQRALAHELRGKQQAGEFFSLSPGLKDYGTRMQAGALNTATQAASRRKEGLSRSRQAEQDKENLRQFNLEHGLNVSKQEYDKKKAEQDKQTKLEAAALAHKRKMEAQAEKDAEAYKRAELTAKQAADKAGRLTGSQVQLGLDKLEKKVKPLEDVTFAVAELENMLAPYAKGGAAEGQNIPGLGFIEGSRSMAGDAYRWAIGGEESQNIFRATQNVLTKLIKESAGLAQTLTETANVLKAYGQQDITSEQIALRGTDELIKALKKDMQRIKSGTHPQVLEQFNLAFPEGTSNPLEHKFQELDYSDYYAARPGEEEEAKLTRADEIRAELERRKGLQNGN